MSRCARCFLPEGFCLCAHVPRVTPRTRVLVIRHMMEIHKPGNTGRLAAMAIEGCTLIDHGLRGGDAPPVDCATDVVLWPDGDSIDPLHAPRRIVVLDGSWPQARRMRQRIAGLAALPRVALPAPRTAIDRLRRTRAPSEMSTLEAIARALGALEGDEIARPLLALHELLVASYRAAYGDPRRTRAQRATVRRMQAKLEDIVRRYGADTGSIHIVEDGVLVMKAHVGLPPHVAQIVARVPIGKGMAGMCAERNEPVNVCNLQTDPSDKIPRGARATGVNGAIVVPIRDAAGAMKGTLGIGVHREYEYTADETTRLLAEAATLIS
jgi:DTW domain-containing protein YfiP/putative methionine-R-sulfoxide reductase with GAF domain